MTMHQELLLLMSASLAVLAPTVILLAVAVLWQSAKSPPRRPPELDRKLEEIRHLLNSGRSAEAAPIAVDCAPTIDSSPKASDVDIFSAKVSFSDCELRDLIEAVAIAGPNSTRTKILSKSWHAFNLIKQDRLDRGLGSIDDPRIGRVQLMPTEKTDSLC